MKIHIFNQQKDLPLEKRAVRLLVRSTLAFLGASCEEVTIYFITEKKIADLHLQFFQDPSPTDCISFPIDSKYLGEVFVCPNVAIRYAKKRKLDPYQETALYIIHGLLHLLGYDDLEEALRRTMRKKEKSCMRHLDGLKITINPKSNS
ncbi:MAG: rRNA maturation RNase YbeY [Chlamydiota bacterium]